MNTPTRSQVTKRILLISILLLAVLTLSFMIGRYQVNFSELTALLFPWLTPDQIVSEETRIVIFNIRLPRIIAGILAGAALSCAGLAFQNIFRNPMASPDLLGASAGAGFGAALGLILGLNYYMVSITAFLCGISAVKLSEVIGGERGRAGDMGLILAGIVVSSLCSAGISFIKLAADPQNTLPEITYWLMGSVANITFRELIIVSPLIITGIVIIYLFRWKINILSLKEDEVRSLGVDTVKIRKIIIFAATLITSATVSVCGIIGWVGLLIPHAAYLIVGTNGRNSVPAAILIGALFMSAVDLVSRTAAGTEIPVGILTSFIGAPFLLYLLIKERKEQ